MSKPLFRDTFFEATKYLGEIVGTEDKFLWETSCMAEEERELVAMLNFIEKHCPNSPMQKNINTILKPFIIELGRARWKRDTVTDLALHKARMEGETESLGGDIETETSDSPETETDTS